MNADILSDFESCERRGYWSQTFVPNKLHPTEVLRRSIAEALTGEREDRGERAGELVMEYASQGLDVKTHQKYECAVHHACLADILTTYLASKGSYSRPEPKVGVNFTWGPYCLLRGQELVRIALVDHWSDDREASEARSWWTLGEMAAFKMPMTIEVLLLGSSVNGRRHSAWSKGLLHPRNRQLRFKKRFQKGQAFADSWLPVWREDHDEISREDWLKAMQEDDVFADLARRVHIEPLSAERVLDLRGMIERKTEKLYKINAVPDPNYSACDWPRPCAMRQVCFAAKPTTPEATGAYRRR